MILELIYLIFLKFQLFILILTDLLLQNTRYGLVRTSYGPVLTYFQIFPSLYWEILYHLTDGLVFILKTKLSKYRIIINIRRFSVSVGSSRNQKNQDQSRPISSVLVRPQNIKHRPWSAKSISTMPPSSAISRPNSAKRIHNGN